MRDYEDTNRPEEILVAQRSDGICFKLRLGASGINDFSGSGQTIGQALRWKNPARFAPICYESAFSPTHQSGSSLSSAHSRMAVMIQDCVI